VAQRYSTNCGAELRDETASVLAAADQSMRQQPSPLRRPTFRSHRRRASGLKVAIHSRPSHPHSVRRRTSYSFLDAWA